ncbi:MAG: hypothetical protein ACLP05_00085 [Candidatus Kryptoniota bacterium]
MLQQVEKKTSQIPITGKIERINEKGIKVNGEWWNFSKFSKNNPALNEGDLIEFKSSKNFINEVIGIVPADGHSEFASDRKAETTTKVESGKKATSESVPSGEQSSPKKGAPAKEQEKDYEVLGACLKDAVYITEDIHEAKFSTQDIVKLALTLFIHRTT